MNCQYPTCHEDSCGITINKVEVCKEHLDWALRGSVTPIKKALGIYKHACPDWDYLVIDKNDPEIMGCVCDFANEVRQTWYIFCDLFQKPIEILKLHEIIKVLSKADTINTGPENYIRLSETKLAQIAYSLGHADRHIMRLAEMNAQLRKSDG